MREPWQDERPATAHHKVEHKWSTWSADRDTWLEREGGAGFLRDLAALGTEGESLTIDVSSSKESRHGSITITGEADEPMADASGVRLPGKLYAKGYFAECWDEIDSIADTLGVDAERLYDCDAIPRSMQCDGPGVVVDVNVEAASVDELLAKIDECEEELIARSAKEWSFVESLFAKRS